MFKYVAGFLGVGELDETVRERVIDQLGITQLAEVVAGLETDDAIEVVEELDFEKQMEVLGSLPENELILPPTNPISPTTKFVVVSLQVNVRARVLSFVVEPLVTALLPSVAVIVILGPTLSPFATA